MNELEAARFVRAGLELLRAALPADHTDYRNTLGSAWEWFSATVTNLEKAAPPWEPEPAESVTLPWSQVACGDSVQAPDGTWYPVDSIARIGGGIVALLVLPTGGTTKTTRDAGDKVPVRRGPAGQAMDVLTAGGLELTLITSGVAA